MRVGDLVKCNVTGDVGIVLEVIASKEYGSTLALVKYPKPRERGPTWSDIRQLTSCTSR